MFRNRHITISIKEFLGWFEEIESDDENLTDEFEGVKVLSNLLTYKVFKHKGFDCPVCKSKGSYFALERSPGRGSKFNTWHFNLYAKDMFGRDVLMTKDHIHPRSSGGTDELNNLQPMCLVCNNKKGAIPMDKFISRVQHSHDFELSNCNNVIVRMKEAYGVSIIPTDFLDMKSIALNAPIIAHRDKRVHYREIKFQELDVIVTWDGKTNSLISVEEYAKKDELFMAMPPELADMQNKADEMFLSIEADVKAIYDAMPADQRTPDAFKASKYPHLIWYVHKKETFKLKRAIRNIVTNKIQKTKSNEARTRTV